MSEPCSPYSARNGPTFEQSGAPRLSPTVQLLDVSTYAELSGIVLGFEPLGAVLRRIAELAVKTIPNADDAALTLFQAGKFKTVAVYGSIAATLDERQYEAGFGPSLDAASTGEMIVLDTGHDLLYPGFTRQAHRLGIRHALSIGMSSIQDSTGALNIYGTGSIGPFDQTAIDLASAFTRQAGVTAFNAVTHASAVDTVAQMHRAMASRAGIEQAKGILMHQQHCTADEAFAILRDTSSRSNRRVRDVAQAVIDQVTSG